MFSKVFTSAALVLALALQASAHAAVAPALGVAGTLKRANVQRPSTKKPCGRVNIASTIDSSSAITASAAGTFTAVATNFNAGADGSRSFTANVDATGTGTNFVAAQVTTNGDAAPTSVGSQTLSVSLPAGTKCTGGTSGNVCLVQFVSTAGFGNCVAVTQGAAAAAAAAPAAAATKKKAARAGTLAARALMAELASEIEARAEETVEIVKRGVASWLFA
ncbi:hypothetical protein BDN70DRAFT_919205 [Pholiota conissans]|uniref:Uncharacterized protein n=1 Tax=Pholiota conissans TaxID=109636 RepID=A0A9P5ZA79_9AGAR|nr:hypothetical protein BDN70DRAFT_919205 [Pholiota conissans]